MASGLKPISITFLHFINFRTITREPSFDSCSSSLSCTPLRSLQGVRNGTSLDSDFVFPLFASGLSKMVP